MVIEGTDYVLAPKVTLLTGPGVTSGFLVGTRRFLFVVPIDAIRGAGRSVTTTTFTIDGRTPLESVRSLLAAPALTLPELEEAMHRLLSTVEGEWIVPIEALAEFRVKTGWFSRGVYYKRSGDRGYRGFPISGREHAERVRSFYGG
jgi:hypothetical protein